MITVCTGFSPAGESQYGLRFLKTFSKYWPPEIDLQVFTERPVTMERGHCRSLLECDGAAEFLERHKENLVVHGRVPDERWRKSSDRARGYNFRFDAFKFFRQILIPQAASERMQDGDVLIWLDGDVETIAQVPGDLAEWALGDAEIAFLGRTQSHSEIGFWAVRINERTRHFLHEIALMYTTDAFLDLPEWHSAYVWDHVRASAGLVERNLCGPSARGHVWPLTALARYTRHDKGDRKPK